MDVQALQKRLDSAGQSHLLQFWEALDENEKQSLYNELNRMNFDEINNFFRASVESLKHASDKLDDLLEPLPTEVCGSVTRTEASKQSEYNNTGKSSPFTFNLAFMMG